MSNEYYTPSGTPSTSAQGASAGMRGEFALLQSAFDKMPTLSGNGSLPLFVNSGATALEAVSAATARSRFGLVIGTNVQAWDADLDALAALAATAGMLSRTGAGAFAVRTLTGTANEITVTNGDGSAGAPTVSLPAALTLTGKTVTGGTFVGSITTPSQITSNQNDYNPASLSTTDVLRISTDARRNITGLAAGASGKTLRVHNVGTFPAVFTYSDALSAAANRFAFGMTLGGGQSMEIQYDATSSLWRATCLPDPIGTIKSFGGGTLPAGYLLRDGSNISRTTYAALFNEVGTTWGVGDGATTFGVGDDRRRVAVGSGGAGTGTLGNSIGNTGGEETHVLVVGEMPSHTHTENLLVGGVGWGGTTNVQQTTGNTGSAGGDGAHNNIQPSVVVTKMIRYC